MRKLLLAGALALIGAALAIVPIPLVVAEPAPPIDVAGHLDVQDPAGSVSGEYLLTAVRIDDASATEAASAWFSDDRDLITQPAVVPPGIDEDEFVELQRRLFRESVRVAAAVGMRAAGLDVTVESEGVRVVGVIRGSPAEDELEQGDVITEVDGEPVEFASELAARTTRARAGDVIELRVQRGDETFDTEIELERVDRLGRPGLGVAVRTLNPSIELPREVDADFGRIGGASGGLMMALTVYDLVTPDDLSGGRVVAGTGTVSLGGQVGEIGEADLKAVAARRAGADVFVVPEGQVEEARSVAGEMEVVGVTTLQEAIDALSGG